MDESREILRRALDLSLAIYRLTERLPEEEILVWQLRKIGNGVIGDLVDENFDKCRKKISLLLIYFKIGQAQNWVREINWLVLKNEYQKLNEQVIKIENGDGNEKKFWPAVDKTNKRMTSHNIGKKEIKKIKSPKLFNLRQQAIIERLKVTDSLKMAELTPLFKDSVSERTLRNDLHVLLKCGVLNKSGANKSTLYFLK